LCWRSSLATCCHMVPTRQQWMGRSKFVRPVPLFYEESGKIDLLKTTRDSNRNTLMMEARRLLKRPVLLGIAYFGLAVLLLSLIGLIAASCLIKILLITYATLLGLLLLGQVIGIIVLASQKQSVQCCGLNSGADFGGTNMVICCYLDGSNNLVDSTCAKTQTVVNSFYYTGCYTPLSAEFNSWIHIIIICFAVGIGIQVEDMSFHFF
uniref:Sarcospan n=1 Tax=Schistocephalus solidus TaxID=70667 RepID=A0A183S799_SCHSO